jgi:hypothetical protein
MPLRVVLVSIQFVKINFKSFTQCSMMKNWMMRQDQKEQMQDDESNIYKNHPHDSLLPFISDVCNIMQTSESLTDFYQTSQKTSDITLVWGAQNSQPHEMVETLRQWTEGYNPVSMQEKSWHGYFSHEYGTSGSPPQ